MRGSKGVKLRGGDWVSLTYNCPSTAISNQLNLIVVIQRTCPKDIVVICLGIEMHGNVAF